MKLGFQAYVWVSIEWKVLLSSLFFFSWFLNIDFFWFGLDFCGYMNEDDLGE